MHLSSVLDSSGQKSTKHFIVLHYGEYSELEILPKKYSELQALVKRLFSLDPEQFHLETDELNVCKGKRLRVPSNLWDDICEFMGNVHVVPRPGGHENQEEIHPESVPSDLGPPESIPLPNPGGVIKLDAAMADNAFILVQIVYMATTSKFSLHLCDHKESAVISASIFPDRGKINFYSTTSSRITRPRANGSKSYDISYIHTPGQLFAPGRGQNLTFHKRGSHFLLLCDFVLVGSVQAPSHPPIVKIVHYPGVDSVESQVSAKVCTISEALKPSSPLFPLANKDVPYQRLLDCNPSDAQRTLEALATIRREFSGFQTTISGVKWSSQPLARATRTKYDWDLTPRSLCVIRVNWQHQSPEKCYICFGPVARDDLYMVLTDKEVVFREGGSYTGYHNVRLSRALLTSGEHSIAVINHDGKIHVNFDFKTSTVLPRDTLLKMRPKECYAQFPVGCTVVLDYYDFSS